MKDHQSFEAKHIDWIGRDAALLSLVEVGLGSVMHAFRFPMRGHLLSLNQGFFLSRSCFRGRSLFKEKKELRFMGFEVSVIVALLKSLSPAGSRITPMIAIALQGFLYSLPMFFFGVNLFSVAFGSALMSVWAFIQPLLFYYLIFGNTAIDALSFYLDRIEVIFSFEKSNWITIVAVTVGIKLLLSQVLALVALWIPDRYVERYEEALVQLSKSRSRTSRTAVLDSVHGQHFSWRERSILALRDLCRPLFLFSFGLTFVFLYFAKTSPLALFWGLLRPLAVGFLIFFLLRSVSFEKVVELLERRRMFQFARSFRIAIHAVRQL